MTPIDKKLIEFLSTPSARRATRPFRAAGTRRAFLSTPSARRATGTTSKMSARLSNFYPRPPRGGRQSSFAKTGRCPQFLSTPSARRATMLKWSCRETKIISIHALREEGD